MEIQLPIAGCKGSSTKFLSVPKKKTKKTNTYSAHHLVVTVGHYCQYISYR